MADYPVRQKSLNGEPKPTTSISRCCHKCGASFILSAPGKTGLRGIWHEWRWFCSVECAPADVVAALAAQPSGGDDR